VDKAISSITGIDYEDIKNSINYNIVRKKLKSRIFSQDEAVDGMANVVNILQHVNHDVEKPISSLLLLGPAGTGKKSTAISLASQIFGSENHFIDFDMSGMTSEFMITEFKGAPPGYVGYGKSGGLVKKVRNNPQSVVYLRNIHRAHPTIIQYIIDCITRGKMTDSAEREASLKNAIIIMAVTLTDQETDSVFGDKNISMGFGKAKKEVKLEDRLKGIVSEELIQASDDVITFNPLDSKTLKRIYQENKDGFLSIYKNININLSELEKEVLNGSKNGHDVMSKLASRIPKIIFNKIKKERNK